MISTGSYYDVAVIGGGLAGLATAIQLSKDGYSVILFEKEMYPFHKVCGEYISLESRELLLSFDVPLEQWGLPVMDTLQLSAPNGNMLREKLPLGGFGVSRYKLDHEMMQIAKRHGTDIREGTKVHEVYFDNDSFVISTDKETVRAKLCCGAFGKRSALDVRWKRPFVQQKASALNNYIGVKYHVRFDHPKNIIALHNFKNGYCGIAAIEDDAVNLCYLTTAQNLRIHGNNIRSMEENVLFKNHFLEEIFSKAAFIYAKPLTISQVSFEKKEQVYEHVLLLGDSAGLITPLCGNGMSMALHSSRIAATYMRHYLQHLISRELMETSYMQEWKKTFSARLLAGRIIQSVFGKPWLTNTVVSALKPFPGLTRNIVRQTHG